MNEKKINITSFLFFVRNNPYFPSIKVMKIL